MAMNEKKIEKIGFIAPSTCLSKRDKSALNKTVNLLKSSFGAESVYLSPYLFSSDEKIDHVSASLEERAEEFKNVIREADLIISVAGGTGAEDLAFKIDHKDLQVIRRRRPLFVGISDFTFLLNQIYDSTRTPVVYFPSLKLRKGNIHKISSLVSGEEVHEADSAWLTAPPVKRFSGIPIGGNLSTFVNFLNRLDPPKFNWKRYILFIEDTMIDVEDVHRLLAALRRHNIFKKIRALVIGSLSQYTPNGLYKKRQKEALNFIMTYLADVIRWRKRHKIPFQILTVSNFGHNISRDLMAVPLGGRVSISKSKKITFSLRKIKKT